MRWPWHHKRKPKKNIAATPQQLQGLDLSSSAVGLAIPLVYGQARLPGNVIHYKQNFTATGVADQTTAAIAMAICEGAISSIIKAYNDKDQSDTQVDYYVANAQYTPGSTTSLTLSKTPIAGSVSIQLPHDGSLSILSVVGTTVTFTAAIPIGCAAIVLSYQYASSLTTKGFISFLGTLSQAAWSFLTTNYPAEAVPYELTAYIAHPTWPIPNNQLANWSFEVAGLLQWGSGIIDANPKDIINDFLTEANHGIGLSSSLIASLTTFRDYCTAAGIFLSPVFDTQRPAADILQELLALTNSAFVWSDGQLKIIPYGDQNLTANGATFTANVTPAYNLTDDDFIAGEGEDPIRVTRRPQSDVYNMVQVEFDNRLTDYDGDIVEAKDQNSIELYQLKPSPVIKAPDIKLAAVARLVAQLALQRQVYLRNTYEFTLGLKYSLLEPMDLVTLTDTVLGYNQLTVRLLEVNENEDETFSCLAEDWIQGVSTAPGYSAAATTTTPRVPPPKPPAAPKLDGSFDSTGQTILNLTGDKVTASFLYVLRTDRLPTLAETRAGSSASGLIVSGIATGISVIPGAAVYIGALAYGADGGESTLSTLVIKRQGVGLDGSGRLRRADPWDDTQYAYRATETDGSTKSSSAHNPQGSFLPAPTAVNPFSFTDGGPATNRMWVAFAWSAITLYRPDGTTISIPASSSYPTPVTPTLSQVASGALGARTLFARIGYMKNGVIHRVGAEASLAVLANNVLKITSPAAVAGFDKWVPMVGSSSGGEFIQIEQPFGSDYQESSTGFNSTTTTPYNSNMDNAATAQALPASTTVYWYPYYDIASGYIAFASRGATTNKEVDAATQNADGHVAVSPGGMNLTTPAGGGANSGTPNNGGGRFV